jgi:uncharacterized protein (TIGR03000 family)
VVGVQADIVHSSKGSSHAKFVHIAGPGTGWVAAQEPAANPPAANQPVHLMVLVPADAQVWLDGTATTAQGSTREYLSPAIAPGQNYVYTVRVRYQQNGQTVDQKRDVTVKAGDFVRLNYMGQGNAEPAIVYGQRAFYFPPEEAPVMAAPIQPTFFAPRSLIGSYYGDTPGWGTADTTGAGG